MDKVREMLDYIEELNTLSVTIRLVLAALFGGFIGIERANQRRAAGLRTFVLVSIGSALSVITNQYLIEITGIDGDPSRMASQVISGIGFLGAGTIIVTGRSNIKGLTTAATLWTTATMGLALGAGYIYAGTLSFVLILITIKILQHVSWHQEETTRYLGLMIEMDRKKGLDVLKDYVSEHDYMIRTLEKQKEKAIKETDHVLYVDIDLKKKTNHTTIVEELMKKEEITFVKELRY